MTAFLHMERMMGIEPTTAAWEAAVLPLNYIRANIIYNTISICRLQAIFSQTGGSAKKVVFCVRKGVRLVGVAAELTIIHKIYEYMQNYE